MRTSSLLAALSIGVGALSAFGQQFTINSDIWDGSSVGTTYSGPNGGNFDQLGISFDGGFDAFDGWMYPNTNSNGGSVSGLSIRRHSDALLSINTYRFIDTYTNVSGAAINATIYTAGNYGSDGSENIVRNDAFGFITHDGPSFDPVIGLMKGNNAFAASNTSFNDDGGGDWMNIGLNVNLAPGESITVMWATFLSRDLIDRSGDIALAQNTVNAMLADPFATGLCQGLSQAEIASISNWTKVPAPGATALLGLAGLAAARRRR